ncbi:hypothetical protein Y1Q_0020842 [Alligator mississippiensis]|uniref:Uncharacterized protein n=1 Tax=Alligator mississippiensis TaxID=8496 RepID=A0A151NJ25_ALLMI|nr:hypothetical protein Y1Q_0020842 [Alligator mississippiensis]
MSECAMVIYDNLQSHGVKSPVAVIGLVSMGRVGDGDVGSIQSPDALGESKLPGSHGCGAQWAPASLGGSCTPLDSLPGGGLAHAEQVSNVPEVGGHGQLQQGDGQLGFCGEGWAHAGVLPLQVGLELLKEIPEGGLGEQEYVQPPLIIPGLLDDVQPPVLAGAAGPEAVELEAQEANGSPGGGILEPLVSIPADGSCSVTTVALGWRTEARQEVAVREGARQGEMALSQVVAGRVGQHSDQQEYGVLVIAARGRGWSSHSAGS